MKIASRIGEPEACLGMAEHSDYSFISTTDCFLVGIISVLSMGNRDRCGSHKEWDFDGDFTHETVPTSSSARQMADRCQIGEISGLKCSELVFYPTFLDVWDKIINIRISRGSLRSSLSSSSFHSLICYLWNILVAESEIIIMATTLITAIQTQTTYDLCCSHQLLKSIFIRKSRWWLVVHDDGCSKWHVLRPYICENWNRTNWNKSLHAILFRSDK